MIVITYVNSHAKSRTQLFSFSQQIKRINCLCIVNWMTFRTHTQNILNNIIEYFQNISIANQLLQKSSFIFVRSGTGIVLKTFESLDQISRK